MNNNKILLIIINFNKIHKIRINKKNNRMKVFQVSNTKINNNNKIKVNKIPYRAPVQNKRKKKDRKN